MGRNLPSSSSLFPSEDLEEGRGLLCLFVLPYVLHTGLGLSVEPDDHRFSAAFKIAHHFRGM